MPKVNPSAPTVSVGQAPVDAQAAAPRRRTNAALRPGEQLASYRIERRLGAGGMGEVYLAFDAKLERQVALKVLPEALALDSSARQRMVREARAASALRHPGIVTIYDVDERDGQTYIAMELVEGETFSELIARRGRLPADEAIALLAQVADAIDAAHRAGVLHRDVKAANLMVGPGGVVKVLDFGLSKRTGPPGEPPRSRAAAEDASIEPPGATDAGEAPTSTPAPRSGTSPRTPPDAPVSWTDDTAVATPTPAVRSSSDDPQTAHGTRMGTPGWAPPELIDGLPADVRSDVFALGCVLFHLLTGQLPFPGTSWAELRSQIAAGAPPPSRFAPQVPPALDAVVLAALANTPSDRPSSALAFVAAARAAVAPRPRRRRAAVIVGVIAAAGVATAVVGATRRDRARTGTPPVGAAARPTDASPGPPTPTAPPTPTQLTHLGGCAFSPTFIDDDTVVFDLTTANAVDLYRVSVRHGDPAQLTSVAGWEWRASRGASTTEVVYLRQAEDLGTIETLDLTTGARRTLLDRNGAVAYARDAYFYAPYQVNELRRVTGGRDEVFLTLPSGQAIKSIAASGDGARLAVTVTGSTTPLCTIELDAPALRCTDVPTRGERSAFGATGRALYHDASGGIARTGLADHTTELVVPGVDGRGGIAVSPSGATLVFSTCVARIELVAVLTDAGHPVVDEDQVGRVTLGPAGALAYTRTNDDGTTSLMIRVSAQPVREVVRVPGRILDVAFAPDGTAAVYAVGESDEPGIWVAALDGTSPPSRLTEGASDKAPVFTADGVAFVRWIGVNTPRLMRVGLDGYGVTPVGARPRLVEAADPSHERVLLSDPGNPHLYWWYPKTGREEPGPPTVARNATTPMALSPSGRWLLTLGGNNGHEVWRQDLAGDAAPARIYLVPDDQAATSGAIDDHGQPLVAISSWAGELWKVPAPDGAAW